MTTRRVGSSQPWTVALPWIVALSVLGAVAGGLLGLLVVPSLDPLGLVVIVLVGAGLSALVVSTGAGGRPSGHHRVDVGPGGEPFRDVHNPGGGSGPPGGREPYPTAPPHQTVAPYPTVAPHQTVPPYPTVASHPKLSLQPPRDGRSPAQERSVDTVRVLLPVDHGDAPAGQWWGQSSPQRRAGPDPGAPAPAPDLAGYVDSARIVQCPRCGEFRIDVAQAGSGYKFRCHVDDHRWEWQPGTPWPATIKVSRRRPDPRRDDQTHIGRG